MDTGPTVRRKRLGAELRRLRVRAGLDQLAIAKHLECSTSKISRAERGEGLLRSIEMLGVLDLCGVTDASAREQLLEIHARAGESGWWEQYEEDLPSGLGVYVGLEADARAVRAWELGWVPGLLQTQDYARAVLAAAPRRTVEEVERLVEVRMLRQQRLHQDAPYLLDLWAVIDGAVLQRPIGGPSVMQTQIEALVDAAARPNITIQVFPSYSRDVHPGLGGSFALLEFPPDEERPGSGTEVIGYVEGPAGNLFLERDRQLRPLVATFDRLRASAHSPEDSISLLHTLAKQEK